jgi:DNA-binding CsgD family transcriptional regulator
MTSSIRKQEKFLLRFNALPVIDLKTLDRFIAESPCLMFSKDAAYKFLETGANFAAYTDNTPESLKGFTDLDMNWDNAGSTAEEFFAGDRQTMHGTPLLNANEVLIAPGKKAKVVKVSKKPLVSGKKCIGIAGAIVDYSDAFYPEGSPKEVFLGVKSQELTPAEYKVLVLYNEGHTRKEMAAILGISSHTIAWHLRMIREKYEVRTRKEMLMLQEQQEG